MKWRGEAQTLVPQTCLAEPLFPCDRHAPHFREGSPLAVGAVSPRPHSLLGVAHRCGRARARGIEHLAPPAGGSLGQRPLARRRETGNECHGKEGAATRVEANSRTRPQPWQERAFNTSSNPQVLSGWVFACPSMCVRVPARSKAGRRALVTAIEAGHPGHCRCDLERPPARTIALESKPWGAATGCFGVIAHRAIGLPKAPGAEPAARIIPLENSGAAVAMANHSSASFGGSENFRAHANNAALKFSYSLKPGKCPPPLRQPLRSCLVV